MLSYLTLIFSCQLVGELIVTALHLPLPGPVLGMALLFAGLLVYGSLPEELDSVATALTSNLSLLFVPAGVGVMVHVGLLGRDLLPISVALVVSTALTIAATALTMVWLNRRPAADTPERQGGAE